MALEPGKVYSENRLLEEFYRNLAGEDLTIDFNKPVSNNKILKGIYLLTSGGDTNIDLSVPISDTDLLRAIYKSLEGSEPLTGLYSNNELYRKIFDLYNDGSVIIPVNKPVSSTEILNGLVSLATLLNHPVFDIKLIRGVETTLFNSVENTDISRGELLHSVLSNALDGDEIYIGSNKFSSLNPFLINKNVSISGVTGSEIYKTGWVFNDPYGIIMSDSDYTLTNLKINANYPSAVIQENDTGLNIMINDCELIGYLDIINSAYGNTYILNNCILRAVFDVAAGAYANVTLNSCNIYITGINTEGDYSGGILSSEGCQIFINNCNILVTGSNSSLAAMRTADGGSIIANDTSIIAVGNNEIYYVNGVRAEDGTVQLINCKMQTTGPGAVDIYNSGSTVDIYGGAGSGVDGVFTGDGFTHHAP